MWKRSAHSSKWRVIWSFLLYACFESWVLMSGGERGKRKRLSYLSGTFVVPLFLFLLLCLTLTSSHTSLGKEKNTGSLTQHMYRHFLRAWDIECHIQFWVPFCTFSQFLPLQYTHSLWLLGSYCLETQVQLL